MPTVERLQDIEVNSTQRENGTLVYLVDLTNGIHFIYLYHTFSDSTTWSQFLFFGDSVLNRTQNDQVPAEIPSPIYVCSRTPSTPHLHPPSPLPPHRSNQWVQRRETETQHCVMGAEWTSVFLSREHREVGRELVFCYSVLFCHMRDEVRIRRRLASLKWAGVTDKPK